jgi:hypothetical protein
MKKLIIAGFVTTLFACNNSEEFDANLDKEVSQPSNASNSMVQPTQNTTPAPIANPNQPSVNNTPVVTSAVTTPAQTTTAAGLNPAHGQPGHRCDLAVGAPLNGAPATKTQPATTTPQNITIKPSTNTTATTTTAPGMNPPHGQPGHRCDISVGAPLNSPSTNPVKKEEKKDEYQVLKPQADTSRN